MASKTQTTGKRVVVRKGANTKSGANKQQTAKSGGNAKTSGSTNGSTARRSSEDLAKLTPDIAKMRKAGKSWDEVQSEHGVNAIVGRKLLAAAGYDAKGNQASAEKITGSGKSLANKVAKERKGGAAWYALALRTGKSEAELKALLEEHGHGGVATGRVYAEAAGGR